MKKILLAILPALLLTTSCVDSLDDYNIDPKAATKVTGATLVANAERNLVRTVVSTSVNLNPFRLYVQYWAQTTYFDESRYDIETRQINTAFWNALYRDVLRDLQEARNIVTADPLMSAADKNSQLAVIEVLEVYTWATLVDTYGDVPYSQALNINQSQPSYDKAATIYTDLFARLNSAITKLKTASGEGFGSSDLVYGGDLQGWLKMANSLKLRMAMTTADVDAGRARTLVQEAVNPTNGGVFSSNEDNADVAFSTALPNTNPLYEDLVNSGRRDFVAANTLLNRLQSTNDPRLDDYFQPTLNSQASNPQVLVYTGGTPGGSNSGRSRSLPGMKLMDPTLPGVLLSYAQVEFLLADALDRGFTGITGTEESHYRAGVRASLEEWGNSDAEIATYLARPDVAYATATGTDRQKIGTQAWLALYNQPVDAWREYRRLDAPSLTRAANALSELPVRLPYPVQEQNLNTTSYNAAASSIGGDAVTTKIFWDVR
ncbi:SusD/RagB family nutrient-binding outer membrane lipoprotein [Hymenobacter coalescens]